MHLERTDWRRGAIATGVVTALLIVAVQLLVVGCSTKREPTVRDGRNVIRKLIDRNGNGLIRLVSFKKTNALSLEQGGARGYVMEYECELEFLGDCKWTHEGIMGEPSFFAATKDDWSKSLFVPIMGVADAKKGERTKVLDTLTFELAENGWRYSRHEDLEPRKKADRPEAKKESRPEPRKKTGDSESSEGNEDPRRDLTIVEMIAITAACEAFEAHVGRLPESLEELLTPPEGHKTFLKSGDLTDAWDNHYDYSINENGPRIVSFGEDRVEGGTGAARDIVFPEKRG